MSAQGGKPPRQTAAGIKGVAVLAPEEDLRASGEIQGASIGCGPTHRPSPASRLRSSSACSRLRIVAAEYQQTTNALLRHPRRQVK